MLNLDFMLYPYIFFFQAEDGIRDVAVTGVQTCALPIYFAGHRVGEVVRKDGLKLIFDDGSWVCYRLSGTEPVVRVYSEARSEDGLEKLNAEIGRASCRERV